MTHPVRTSRVILAAVAMAIGFVLAACGSSEAPESAPTTSAPTTSGEVADYPFDTSTTGDDLLSTQRREYDFGSAGSVSWQLPAFYVDGEIDELSASIEVDGVLFGVVAVATTEFTPGELAERSAGRSTDDDPVIENIELDGRQWTAFVSDGNDFSRVEIAGTVSDGVTVMASFTATGSLADVPEERIAELHQMALSFESES